MVEREGCVTSFQVQHGERLPLSDLRLSAAVNAEKRKLPAPGEGCEFPAERGDTISFAEAIREEGDSYWGDHRGLFTGFIEEQE